MEGSVKCLNKVQTDNVYRLSLISQAGHLVVEGDQVSQAGHTLYELMMTGPDSLVFPHMLYDLILDDLFHDLPPVLRSG